MGEGNAGQYVSLAVDANNAPHLAYLSSVSDDKQSLKYATSLAGTWATSNVERDGVGKDASILVDGQGKLHIVYRDFGAGILKHATNACP